MAISAEFTADFTQFNSAAQEAGQAIRAFTADVTAFAKDYISAFAEEEAATARLTTALKATGEASIATIANYQAMSEQFQATTRYSDDAITRAQTAFTTIGQVGPDLMQPAIQAAADLGAALGIDVADAATKIATVIGTDGAKLGTLAKYLGDVDVKGKSAADILEIFNQKFGGSAAADMETTTGKLENFNNKLDDFKSKAGEALATALLPLLDAFQRLSPGVQTLIAGSVALGVALAPLALSFAALTTVITPLLPLLAGLVPFLGPGALIIAGAAAIYLAFKNWDQIVGVVAGVYNAIKTYLVDRFNALVESVLAPIRKVAEGFKWLKDVVVGHSYVPDMMAGIQTEFQKLDRIMVQPAVEAADQVAEAFRDSLRSMPAIAGLSGFDAFGRPAISPFLSGLPVDRTPPVTTYNPGTGTFGNQITVNYPIMNDPHALNQLGDLMGRALAQKNTKAGRSPV